MNTDMSIMSDFNVGDLHSKIHVEEYDNKNNIRDRHTAVDDTVLDSSMKTYQLPDLSLEMNQLQMDIKSLNTQIKNGNNNMA